MHFLKNERNWVVLLLTVLTLAFITVVFFTHSSFGGGDHYEHYKLAHFGWKYPKLLFSHWGKPVFTILVSPFAQFGINGARIYNVLSGLLTAFISWKLAKHLGFRYAWLVIIFVVFTPIYFASMFTSLTEVSYSLFLVFSIYLFFSERFIFSAIILSFTPLIRTEGIVILPLFILAYFLKKEYRALPFLLTGFLIISALGSPYYDSFWWLISEMPYTGEARDLYGSGSLWHFVNHTPNITGGPIAVLFVLGLAALYLKWAKNKAKIVNDWFYFALLVPASFLVFFAAHSFVWWQGMGNSLGLIRVIASVSPLASLTAVFGLQYVLDFNFRYREIITPVIVTVLVIWIVIDGANKHKYGFKESDAEILLNEAANFIRANHLERHKLYYFNSYIILPLDIDPYDLEKCQQWYNNNQPNVTAQLPDSSIVVWDAHFGPNEGGVPLEMLQNQDGIVELSVFKPEIPFQVLGGHDYEVIVFQKLNAMKKQFLTTIHEDFEGPDFDQSGRAFSGKNSRLINPELLYGNLCKITYASISNKLAPFDVKVSFAILFEKKLKPKELSLVCSLEQADSLLMYRVADTCFENTEPGKWKAIELNFSMPAPLSSENVLKIYFYNKQQLQFFVDDVNIQFVD